MISKELLGKVLDREVVWIEIVEPNEITGSFGWNINIYELAYKCKEWAKSKGWHIESSVEYCGDNKPYARPVHNSGCEWDIVEECTEPEAIFKACECILEQQGGS